MTDNEKPAIGSSEAAVLTVVELIARSVQMSEQHLAYWLDLYYQVRSRYEAEKGTPLEVTVDGPAIPEPSAGSKKKQRLTGADLRKVQEKAGTDNGAGYQWRAYKRSVLQRLSEARERGVTSSAIAEASGGKLTDNAVMDFLEAAFRPIDDYRALEAALDRLAET